MQLVVYQVQRRLYRYNHIQVNVRDENSCRHVVRSHGKAISKSHHNKRAPVVHCLVIQLHSHRRLLLPLCFQPHSRRRLLLPLSQLCQLCCSFPLPHQQYCCQLHEYRPDCQMHYLLVPESLVRKTEQHRQPIGYPYNDRSNGTPIEGVSFTSFFLVITSNTSI